MALFYQKGTISDMSEVRTGTSMSGKEWERMDLILEIPGYQGAVYKMVFSVSGENVKKVLLLNRGDSVEIGFTVHAREWNGRWYNNVEAVKIVTPEDAPTQAEPSAPEIPVVEVQENITADLPF